MVSDSDELNHVGTATPCEEKRQAIFKVLVEMWRKGMTTGNIQPVIDRIYVAKTTGQ